MGLDKTPVRIIVSTHSRPKAAGHFGGALFFWQVFVSTHSRPKAAGNVMTLSTKLTKFQHTAARRRLDQIKAATSNR